MIFAAALVPVVGMIGASVDFGRTLNVRTHMQDALDAAVLAGGRQFQLTGDTAAAEGMARDYFDQRAASGRTLPGNPQIASVAIDTSAYTITIRAEADVPTPFLGLVGWPSLAVAATSQSGLAIGGSNEGKDLEVSLMLDITGSMNDATSSGNKLSDAKLAAKDLIEILLPDGYSGNQSSRIALAPFSQYVNVGPTFYRTVTNYDPPGSGSTCVTERTGLDRYTDAPPGTNAWIGRYTVNSNRGTLSCAPVSRIVPLTNNKPLLKSSIDGYSASGWTAGHLGTAWAWYLISHRWAGVWPASSRPGAPGADRLKVAVLMTDGDYNTYFRNSTESQTQAQSLCTGMKSSGVLVYTIAFGDDISSPAKAALRSCASSSDHFFSASSGTELRQAFRAIGFTLSRLRLMM